MCELQFDTAGLSHFVLVSLFCLLHYRQKALSRHSCPWHTVSLWVCNLLEPIGLALPIIYWFRAYKAVLCALVIDWLCFAVGGKTWIIAFDNFCGNNATKEPVLTYHLMEYVARKMHPQAFKGHLHPLLTRYRHSRVTPSQDPHRFVDLPWLWPSPQKDRGVLSFCPGSSGTQLLPRFCRHRLQPSISFCWVLRRPKMERVEGCLWPWPKKTCIDLLFLPALESI